MPLLQESGVGTTNEPENEEQFELLAAAARQDALSFAAENWGAQAKDSRDPAPLAPAQDPVAVWTPPLRPPRDEFRNRLASESEIPPNGKGMEITTFHDPEDSKQPTLSPDQPFEIWMAVYDPHVREIGPDGHSRPMLIGYTKAPEEMWRGNTGTGSTEFEQLAPTFLKEGDIAVFETNSALHIELDSNGNQKLDQNNEPIYRYKNASGEPIDPIIVLEVVKHETIWQNRLPPGRSEVLKDRTDIPGVDYSVTRDTTPGVKRELIDHNDAAQVQMVVKDNQGNVLGTYGADSKFSNRSGDQQLVPFLRDLLRGDSVASGDRFTMNVSKYAATAWTLSYPAHSPESQFLLSMGLPERLEFSSYLAVGQTAQKTAELRNKTLPPGGQLDADKVVELYQEELKRRNPELHRVFTTLIPDPQKLPDWVMPAKDPKPLWLDASGKPIDLVVELEVRKQPYKAPVTPDPKK